MKLSVVTTLYKSEPYVMEFHRRMTVAASHVSDSFEIIYVDDASPDQSVAVLERAFAADHRMRIIRSPRKTGQQQAMLRGLKEARGELIFLIDSDLEEPPETLLSCYDAMDFERVNAVESVFTVRSNPKKRLMERLGSKVFYFVARIATGIRLPSELCQARLMTRAFAQAACAHPKAGVCLPLAMCSLPAKQKSLRVEKKDKGTSGYTFWQKAWLGCSILIHFARR